MPELVALSAMSDFFDLIAGRQDQLTSAQLIAATTAGTRASGETAKFAKDLELIISNNPDKTVHQILSRSDVQQQPQDRRPE
jgi:hypothetical protein